MSKRAEQYARILYTPWSEDGMYRRDNTEVIEACIKGYEQAEKDTIERAIAWLKENTNKYIVDLTPTYPDAPVELIVGGMCWVDLKKYMENE